MNFVRPWISLGRESYWFWILRKLSRQCHSNPVLFTPCKPPNIVKDLYDSHTYGLKTRVDMYKDGCGSSGVWDICSDILIYDKVISVYYWD